MKKIHRLELIDLVLKKDKKKSKSWESLIQLIERYQCSHMIYPVFFFLSKLYPGSIPGKVLKQIRPINAENVYNLNPDLVFDERVNFSRVINKLKISWQYSPTPFYKRLMLITSPEIYILVVSYGQIILNSLVMKAVRKLRS